MSFLKNIGSNPKDLVGPNVSKASEHVIDLSGTKLSFACPRQTSTVPSYSGGSNFDINVAPTTEPNDPQTASCLIYKSAWDFYDRPVMGSAYGGLYFDIVIVRKLDVKDIGGSLFNEKNLEKYGLEFCERFYGGMNRERWENRENYEEPFNPDTSLLRYPKSSSDFSWSTINQHKWLSYEVSLPGRKPKIRYDVAISYQHAIEVLWTPSTYDGRDYFSPEHNLPVAMNSFINQIMATMKIALSPDAQRQFEEAMSH